MLAGRIEAGSVARLAARERLSRRRDCPHPRPPLPIHGRGEIVFLPPQPFDDYCRLLQLADVILDPPHYGAGSSCYDLFSFNLPVVTLPGELIVGRITQACYRKMGVEDLVVHSAEEYVSKAVQVATDRDYRKYVTERIAEASDVLFNDLEAVREHERFFETCWQSPLLGCNANHWCRRRSQDRRHAESHDSHLWWFLAIRVLADRIGSFHPIGLMDYDPSPLFARGPCLARRSQTTVPS